MSPRFVPGDRVRVTRGDFESMSGVVLSEPTWSVPFTEWDYEIAEDPPPGFGQPRYLAAVEEGRLAPLAPNVTEFRGENRWLSNFYRVSQGWTVEHYFQAAKFTDPGDRERVLGLPSPADAKRAGREAKLPPDWEKKKPMVMWELLKTKFADPFMKSKLLELRCNRVTEGNVWHDNYWGVCSCSRCGGKGRDVLGKMLTVLMRRARIEAVEGNI